MNLTMPLNQFALRRAELIADARAAGHHAAIKKAAALETKAQDRPRAQAPVNGQPALSPARFRSSQPNRAQPNTRLGDLLRDRLDRIEKRVAA